jgi:hypothetical protein
LRGGLSGAGASSTDANIAANIERGFAHLARREMCDKYYL